MVPLVLQSPRVTGHRDVVRLEATFRTGEGDGQLWFEVPADWADFLESDLCDAFVLGLLPLAVSQRSDLLVQGPVSARLVHGLNHTYLPVQAILLGASGHGSVRASEVVHGGQPAEGAATGFSGGIDSFCAVRDLHLDAPPEAVRLTHLALFNVGSHESGERGRAVFRQRAEQLMPCADDLGLPLVLVDSNLDDLLPYGFQRTHTTRSFAAAMALQRGWGTYYYSSGQSFAATKVTESSLCTYVDPVAIPALASDTFRPIPYGAHYSRVDKTERVAPLEAAQRFLDVCVDPKVGRTVNCSACTKCLRTMLTLELLGWLDQFSEVFDLSLYETVRTKYMVKLLNDRSDELAAEVREALLASHTPIPPLVRLEAWLRRMLRPLKHLVGHRG
jgi:hypothetical protein